MSVKTVGNNHWKDRGKGAPEDRRDGWMEEAAQGQNEHMRARSRWRD